jgi:MoxR-like ATPase
MREGYGAGEPLDGFSEPAALTAAGVAEVPESSGVHVVWDEAGRLVYIGHSGRQRARLREHLAGNRQTSILHDKVGRLLDQELGRPARSEEIRSRLTRWTFAWRETAAPEELKAQIMDRFHPMFNERRPGASAELPSPNPRSTMPSMLQAVLDALQRRPAADALAGYMQLIEVDIPEMIATATPGMFDVRGRTRMGEVADVPWVALFPSGDVPSAKRGIYVVYLFASNGSRVYLSLNQGTEEVRGGAAALRKRALDIRAVVGVRADLLTEIDLASDNQRPKRYEAANAYAVQYRSGQIPDAETLRRDLDRFLELLSKVLQSAIQFHPDREPVHLLVKWSAERNRATIEDHRAVVRAKGAVWWAKFGTPGTTAISDARLTVIRRQVHDGIETHCYLYRKGEVWRTTLEEITTDPAQVQAELLPGYYDTSECNLFVRLRDFQQLEPDWPLEHLTLVTNPDPLAIVGALGNQTSPLSVYERLQPMPEPAPKEELTIEWLERETLLPRAELQEMLVTLERRPQIILAGPPGTSKTWIATRLARYLTQGESLAYRVLQFHPSYGYEEFVEGLRPAAEGGAIVFRREDGAVLRMVDQIEAAGQPHVLVLDEMNRANLPRVFGELMYLLEYRDEPLDLLYTQGFSLPGNLVFIGTMNTADRSIRSIDIALRRRFEVFECPPSRRILERFYRKAGNEVPDLLDGFDRLNQRLQELLDRHHTIGHSFFMADPMTAQRLRAVWRRQLAPLLEEYFFDQPDIAATLRVEEFWPSVATGESTD